MAYSDNTLTNIQSHRHVSRTPALYSNNAHYEHYKGSLEQRVFITYRSMILCIQKNTKTGPLQLLICYKIQILQITVPMTCQMVCLVRRRANGLNVPWQKMIKLKIYCQNSVTVATVRERVRGSSLVTLRVESCSVHSQSTASPVSLVQCHYICTGGVEVRWHFTYCSTSQKEENGRW